VPSSRPHQLASTPSRTCAARRRWTASADADVAAATPAPPAIWHGGGAISAKMTSLKPVMTAEDVMAVLPHRYPFLLVDKVVAYEAGKRCVAIKNVSVNEPFFPGHFPGRPIMPGVLQLEALAQTAGLLLKDLISGEEKKDFFFGGVDNVRWRKPVVPGDALVMEAEITSFKARFGVAKVEAKAYVDGELACEADLTLVIDVKGKASR
jgi:3-hydroxyacyl-[acyl-carrier-protein] dehydratase